MGKNTREILANKQALHVGGACIPPQFAIHVQIQLATARNSNFSEQQTVVCTRVTLI